MLRGMRPRRKSHLWSVLTTLLLLLIGLGCGVVIERTSSICQDMRARPPFTRLRRARAGKYFQIQVVDRQTGRGVPLVELRTTNNARYFTDSNGIIAFYEPGLMDREVFFFVESHGYGFPKDGFGFRGTRLKTSPGASAVIKIDRLNIAERLYRVTGQGIYRDSVLTGHPVPLKNPVLNGQVMGQDSVYTCIYRDRLFWLWGDTNRPSYPLGHFATAGAFSDLPGKGGLDPSVGIDLEYFVDDTGFSRPICRLKEKGLVWLDGLLTVKDKQDVERLVAKHARMKDLGQAYERGLVVFNDATQLFEPLVRCGVEFLPYSGSGHAFSVNVDGRKYYYFATPFPMAVRMRVRARWDDVTDANCYEALTAVEPKRSTSRSMPRLDVGGSETPYRWVHFGNLTGDEASRASVIEALEKEKQDVHLYDIESGKKVSPHGGTVYFNAYRQRWVAIFVQQFGESSFLGEVWYAEADTPVGPWAYARKIVTHNKYSFYNPKQHPLFDQDGGRVIFCEGTYSYTFSGSAESATPRYDYNQIMYRLNLNDPRLVLPVAVYETRDTQNGKDYLLRDGVEKASRWNLVQSVPFYAIEPDRAELLRRACSAEAAAKAGSGFAALAKADSNLIPVYAQKVPAKSGKTISFTVERPNSSAKPLFCALASTDSAIGNPCIVPLYEYHHAGTGRHLYSTEPHLQKSGWTRMENPLCWVWKAPSDVLLLDTDAKPIPQRFAHQQANRR